MKRFRKVLAISGTIFLTLGIGTGVYIASMTCFREYRQTNHSLKTWMKDIKDDTKINEIIMPGSHDAGTYGMSWLGATQHLTIEEQLKLGVRYFDLRVNKVDNEYVMFHSILNGTKFDPILDSIVQFLDENPSETLLLDFQHFKNGSDDYVYNEVNERLKGKLVVQDESQNELQYVDDLTLKETRGKCIVFFNSSSTYIKEKHIFSRNDDACTKKGQALDSCYISDFHAYESDKFIEIVLINYANKIKEKISKEEHKGIFVLQCQLTDKSLLLGPFHKERSHEENMNHHILNFSKTEYFDIANVIMRDFLDENKTQSIIDLNECKGIFKK